MRRWRDGNGDDPGAAVLSRVPLHWDGTVIRAQAAQELIRAGEDGTTLAQGHGREPIACSFARKALLRTQLVHAAGRDSARGRLLGGSRMHCP